MTKTPYYITTAIAYASGKPHIGNCYEIVMADAIARYKRSQGFDVFFQTGSDEMHDFQIFFDDLRHAGTADFDCNTLTVAAENGFMDLSDTCGSKRGFVKT